MTARQYRSTVEAKTLSAGINNSVTSMTLNSITTLPTTYPYTLVIDPDTATEEIVTVTALASGTTLTIARGQDGTSPQSHNAAAVVKHMITARDLQDAQNHIEASTGGYTIVNDGTGTTQSLHGIATGEGAVVGTLKTQTLTNKTLTSPTITGAVISSANIVDGTIVNADINDAAAIASSKISGTAVTLAGTETLTNKTLTSAVINNLSLNALTSTSTPLTITSATPPAFSLTNAERTSSTQMTFTAASPPPVVAGDKVTTTVFLFSTSANLFNPFNLEEATVATVSGNTFTVNVPSGTGSNVGTFGSGSARKIITTNILRINDSGGSQISAMDSLGRWNNDAYLNAGYVQNSAVFFDAPYTAGGNATCAINNIPSSEALLFYGEASTTNYQDVYLSFTSNGAAVSSGYNIGTISKEHNSNALTSSGETGASSVLLSSGSNASVYFHGNIRGSYFNITVLNNSGAKMISGRMTTNPSVNGIFINNNYRNINFVTQTISGSVNLIAKRVRYV